jgi:hypothetical protein
VLTCRVQLARAVPWLQQLQQQLVTQVADAVRADDTAALAMACTRLIPLLRWQSQLQELLVVAAVLTLMDTGGGSLQAVACLMELAVLVPHALETQEKLVDQVAFAVKADGTAQLAKMCPGLIR